MGIETDLFVVRKPDHHRLVGMQYFCFNHQRYAYKDLCSEIFKIAYKQKSGRARVQIHSNTGLCKDIHPETALWSVHKT